MLGREPIIDVDGHAAQFRPLSTEHHFVLQSAQAESAAVVNDKDGTTAAWGALGSVDPDRDGGAVPD